MLPLYQIYNDSISWSQRLTFNEQRLFLQDLRNCLPVQGSTYCLSMPQLSPLIDSPFRLSHQIVSTYRVCSSCRT
ncbi:hypothetical protein BDW22DRAFT_1363687 [Trametopsis cervina]|nr:hypothetical protein BDW22DRAFT_1363687 [Trametopsis cervina]